MVARLGADGPRQRRRYFPAIARSARSRAGSRCASFDKRGVGGLGRRLARHRARRAARRCGRGPRGAPRPAGAGADVRRSGCSGTSQGGWVVARGRRRPIPTAPFVVTSSGPGVTPRGTGAVRARRAPPVDEASRRRRSHAALRAYEIAGAASSATARTSRGSGRGPQRSASSGTCSCPADDGEVELMRSLARPRPAARAGADRVSRARGLRRRRSCRARRRQRRGLRRRPDGPPRRARCRDPRRRRSPAPGSTGCLHRRYAATLADWIGARQPLRRVDRAVRAPALRAERGRGTSIGMSGCSPARTCWTAAGRPDVFDVVRRRRSRRTSRRPSARARRARCTRPPTRDELRHERVGPVGGTSEPEPLAGARRHLVSVPADRRSTIESTRLRECGSGCATCIVECVTASVVVEDRSRRSGRRSSRQLDRSIRTCR